MVINLINERISMLCILVSYDILWIFRDSTAPQFSEPPIQNRCLRFAHFALLMGGESPIIGGWSWIYGSWLPRNITIDFLTWRYFNLLAGLDIFGGKCICWCLSHMGPMCFFRRFEVLEGPHFQYGPCGQLDFLQFLARKPLLEDDSRKWSPFFVGFSSVWVHL